MATPGKFEMLQASGGWILDDTIGCESRLRAFCIGVDETVPSPFDSIGNGNYRTKPCWVATEDGFD